MSGHSKWSKIKHKKGLNDAKRGKVFSKMAQQIAVAARDGADTTSNFALRLLVDKAKAVSMPSENVQRAIDKGSGKGGNAVQYEEAIYEGFGPGGFAVIVVTLTDNKNRTVAEMRSLFSENGGSIGENGSVSWNFDQRGRVTLRPAKVKKAEQFGKPDTIEEFSIEEILEKLIEVEGILDMRDYVELDEGEAKETQFIEVYTEVKDLAKVRDAINAMNYIITASELVWMPKMVKEDISIEKVEGFIERLEESDDVQNIFTDVV